MSETGKNYKTERAAIEALRRAYPIEGQKTLAKRIISRNNFVGPEAELARSVGYRPFFSIYSAIRRFDLKLRAAVHPLSPLATA